MIELENIRPSDIEQRSMELIEAELGDVSHLTPQEKQILKRVIHTTADFSYCTNLKFSRDAVSSGLQALQNGAVIITDTHMAESGISKPALKALGCTVQCFMSDASVAEQARLQDTTRAIASMDKAAELFSEVPVIYAIGNAPTALIRLHEQICEKKIHPALVIGVPVGFVNVVASKERILQSDVPYIVAAGRKGGSNVAAAICNAMLYQLYKRK